MTGLLKSRFRPRHHSRLHRPLSPPSSFRRNRNDDGWILDITVKYAPHYAVRLHTGSTAPNSVGSLNYNVSGKSPPVSKLIHIPRALAYPGATARKAPGPVDIALIQPWLFILTMPARSSTLLLKVIPQRLLRELVSAVLIRIGSWRLRGMVGKPPLLQVLFRARAFGDHGIDLGGVGPGPGMGRAFGQSGRKAGAERCVVRASSSAISHWAASAVAARLSLRSGVMARAAAAWWRRRCSGRAWG